MSMGAMVDLSFGRLCYMVKNELPQSLIDKEVKLLSWRLHLLTLGWRLGVSI